MVWKLAEPRTMSVAAAYWTRSTSRPGAAEFADRNVRQTPSEREMLDLYDDTAGPTGPAP